MTALPRLSGSFREDYQTARGPIADFLRAALDRFLAAVLARGHNVPANQPVRLSLRPSSCFIGRQGIRRRSNER
jgi:hypothetical protein